MARQPNKIEVHDLDDDSIDQPAVATALAALREQGAQAAALAEQIGYDGGLTVGALEDGIRFYQRRSVEALLEVGKRLLLLREITPVGEFDGRTEMLGFSRRSAYRFMQAASKTAKSAKLALLSNQVKSTSAFLELVTHDDDADLDRLAELDDIERMSASQVRAALRESRAEHEATQTVMAKKQARIDQLERGQALIARLPPDEQLARLKKEAAAIAADAEGAILGGLRQALIALGNHGDERGQHGVFMAGLVGQVQAQLAALRLEFDLPDVSTAADAALAGEVAQWAQ